MYIFIEGNGSLNKAVRYSLEELMTSEQTQLGQIEGRLKTQRKLYCWPGNFLVLDDQITVVGVEYEEKETENGTLRGMIELKYDLFKKMKYI